MTMTHSDDIRMILSNLSRLDDATERAALDFREKAARTEPGLKEREALRGRETVPYIVVKGVAAIAPAMEGDCLAAVLRAWPQTREESAASYRIRCCNGHDLSLVERAMESAAVAHENQRRKEGGFPYIAHPLAIALHLACCGHDEQCVAAALVHDVIEDTDWDEARLAQALGDEAERCMALVRFATEMPKDVPWRARKEAVVAKLADAARDERALVIADKGHNLRSLLRALRKRGGEAWTTLRHGRPEQSWFAHALADAVRSEPGEPFDSYAATVEEAVRAGWLEAV